MSILRLGGYKLASGAGVGKMHVSSEGDD
jgi:hypothetical protein